MRISRSEACHQFSVKLGANDSCQLNLSCFQLSVKNVDIFQLLVNPIQILKNFNLAILQNYATLFILQLQQQPSRQLKVIEK